MPYEWQPADAEQDQTKLRLWPYQSLKPAGFAAFISITALFLTLPLLAVLGSPVLWGLLPFFAMALTGVWLAIRRNARDGEIVEELSLSFDEVHLTRSGPHGRIQDWHANSHWVRAYLHKTGGPVPNYVTLQGGPREVEIGAFLSEDERVALMEDLTRALDKARNRPV
jgi:uncharacterized membrane protein